MNTEINIQTKQFVKKLLSSLLDDYHKYHEDVITSLDIPIITKYIDDITSDNIIISNDIIFEPKLANYLKLSMNEGNGHVYRQAHWDVHSNIHESLKHNRDYRKYIIYIDLDGVLADFYKAIDNLSLEYDVSKKNIFKNRLYHKKGFYDNVEPLKNYDNILRYCDSISDNCYVLTATCASYTEICDQKKEWVSKHCSAYCNIIDVICDKDKYKYSGAMNILIDDTPKKHKEKWVEAGGIFIHHTSYDDTISQLIDLVYCPDPDPDLKKKDLDL